MNRSQHLQVAIPVGAVAALINSSNLPNDMRWAECLGGAIGGGLGGIIPTLGNLPSLPLHRQDCHDLAVMGPALRAWQQRIVLMQEWLRTRAEQHRQCCELSDNQLTELFHWLMTLLCHLASGAVAGFGPGIASHLVLDQSTPYGLLLAAPCSIQYQEFS